MKRRITTFFLVVLLVSGFGMMAYPSISNWINASSQTYIIENYQNNINKMNRKEIDAAKKAAQEYDKTEVASVVDNSCITKLGKINAEEYEEEGSYANILNVGETMGYLKIPKLQLSLPIFHGTSDLVMQKGVGHMEGTSMPIGGEGTHCVLVSHSGLPESKLFTDLDELKKGDKFYLYVLDECLTYEVDQVEVVLPTDTSNLEVIPNKDYVTLLTCTPIGTNTHRLLVRGERILEKYPSQTEKHKNKEEVDTKWMLGFGLLLAVLIIGIISHIIIVKKRNKM